MLISLAEAKYSPFKTGMCPVFYTPEAAFLQSWDCRACAGLTPSQKSAGATPPSLPERDAFIGYQTPTSPAALRRIALWRVILNIHILVLDEASRALYADFWSSLSMEFWVNLPF